jgi:hypothetical protein
MMSSEQSTRLCSEYTDSAKNPNRTIRAFAAPMMGSERALSPAYCYALAVIQFKQARVLYYLCVLLSVQETPGDDDDDDVENDETEESGSSKPHESLLVSRSSQARARKQVVPVIRNAAIIKRDMAIIGCRR